MRVLQGDLLLSPDVLLLPRVLPLLPVQDLLQVLEMLQLDLPELQRRQLHMLWLYGRFDLFVKRRLHPKHVFVLRDEPGFGTGWI